ncbi:MAG: choice-of-anchor U domain-containing protein [Thermodesulfobacteriota bacterium]
MKSVIMRFLPVPVLVLLLCTPAHPACTVSYTTHNATTGVVNVGQSWTATCSGVWTSITILADNPNPGSMTLKIYKGQSVAAGDLLHSETFASCVDGLQTYTLSNPQSVTSGNQYTFLFTNNLSNAIKFRYDTANGYAGGMATAGVGFVAGSDIYFEMSVVDPTYTLSCSVSGLGSGALTSSPSGIDCPGTCAAEFVTNSGVTLFATPGQGSAFDGWSDASCSGNGPCRITMDQDKSVTATFNPDTDADGISNTIENTGPNGGDGNADGILDSQQNNVASFKNIYDQWCTIASETGTALEQVCTLSDPSCGNCPALTFPQGFFSFKIKGLLPGQSTVLTILLHTRNASLTEYYKYGPTADNPADHWYVFPYGGSTGAEILQGSSTTTIRLHLVDGGIGDDDLKADGEITDAGGPAVGAAGSESGNDSGCFISRIR